MFLNLYKMIVRPHLEYASTVWSVLYKKDCISIENVQRRATRMEHSIRHLNYSDRLRELGLPSLQYIRARADLIEVYKILNGIDKCDKNKLFQNQPNQRTRGHSQKLFKHQFRLDLRKQTNVIKISYFKTSQTKELEVIVKNCLNINSDLT